MRKLIEMPYEGDVPVIVAVDVPVEEVEDEIRDVGVLDYFRGKPEKVEQNFGILSMMIVKYSIPIIKALEELQRQNIPLNKATAEFGVSFTGKGSVFLVEASAGATITVNLEWSPVK